MSDQEEDRSQEAAPSVRDNLLAQVQGLHKEAKSDHWLDLSVPGYKNLLWLRFKPFPVERVESKMGQFQRDQKAGLPILLNNSCDTLIDACEQVFLLPGEFGGGTDRPVIGEKGRNLIPIDEEASPPVALDTRLESILKLDNPDKTSRGIVVALFSTEQAITAMNVRVSQWMQDVTREVNQDLLGE